MNKVIVKNSAIQGQGVYADTNIAKGEVVLEMNDTHVVTDESTLTPHQHEFDLDYLADGKIILMQEPEKFINHSCDPSTFVKTRNGLRLVLAMRNIRTGEEITYDYSMNGDNDGTFICKCGSKNCRKVYQGNFFKLPVELQIKYLPYLDNWFVKSHDSEVEKLKLRSTK